MDKAINDKLIGISLQLKQVSELFNELKLQYIGEGLYGFAAFVKNESKERWEMCDNLRINILKHGGVLGLIPTQPPLNIPDFSNPVIPLSTMVSHDKSTLNKISTVLEEAEKQKIHCAIFMLTHLYEKLLYEFSEVKQMEVKIMQIMKHPERLMDVNKYLLDHYGYAFSNYEQYALKLNRDGLKMYQPKK